MEVMVLLAFRNGEDIAGKKEAVQGETEMDALIAYLQSLGTALQQADK